MATRKPIADDKQENRLSDSGFEEWDTISSEFGTKIEWGDGTNGTTDVFVGEFLGVNSVALGEPDDQGNPLDTAEAAEFVDANGEKFYSWLNFALKNIIEDETMIPGDTVRICYAGTAPTKRNLNPVTKLTIQRKPR